MPDMGDSGSAGEGDAGAADTGMEGAGSEGAQSSGAGDPGFGDVAGVEALPDMRDTPPAFEGPQGESNSRDGGAGGNSNNGIEGAPGADGTESDGSAASSAGNPAGSDAPADGDWADASEPGTRASGGLEGMEGANGPLTTAEQVAILDRQLEQSTSDFDSMILEEQARQRAMDRERAAQRSQRESAEPATRGGMGNSRYQDDVAMGGSDSRGGGGMGGASRGGSTAPENPAIFTPPEDIPQGDDDDVVARQLREAAMREPDPEVRERLWNEYRKYKGLEIPEE